VLLVGRLSNSCRDVPQKAASNLARDKESGVVCRYMATYDCAPCLLKLYVPLIVTISTLAVVFIEVRVGFGFVTGR
jgi:hypothetical protein